MVTSTLSLVQYPVSLRLNRKFSENLSRPESKDAEQLRKDVVDNVSVSPFAFRITVSKKVITGLNLIFIPAQ